MKIPYQVGLIVIPAAKSDVDPILAPFHRPEHMLKPENTRKALWGQAEIPSKFPFELSFADAGPGSQPADRNRAVRIDHQPGKSLYAVRFPARSAQLLCERLTQRPNGFLCGVRFKYLSLQFSAASSPYFIHRNKPAPYFMERTPEKEMGSSGVKAHTQDLHPLRDPEESRKLHLPDNKTMRLGFLAGFIKNSREWVASMEDELHAPIREHGFRLGMYSLRLSLEQPKTFDERLKCRRGRKFLILHGGVGLWCFKVSRD